MKFTNLIVLGLVMMTARYAQASVSHSSKNSLAPSNLELWCGATVGAGKEKFPYLAAIKNYRGRNGRPMQVATVYEKGRVVLRQYVYRHPQLHSVAYESSGDAFSLTLAGNKGYSSWADFKAVVRDSDGTKLIGNGSIPCYLRGKRT